MTTKLNLTIEENIARQIKLYAEKKNISVSKITEEYYKKLIGRRKKTGQSFVDKHEEILNKYSGKTIDIEKAR